MPYENEPAKFIPVKLADGTTVKIEVHHNVKE